MKTEYKVGTCNIGPEGRKRRFLTGVVGLVLALLTWIFLKSLVGLYVFSIAGFIGLIQARSSFCIAYGLKNSMNLDEGEKKVLANEASKNRVQALKIILISTIAGLVFGFAISKLIA